MTDNRITNDQATGGPSPRGIGVPERRLTCGLWLLAIAVTVALSAANLFLGDVNQATSNFLSLEDTARLFCRTMDLHQQYRSLLPHACHQVRYEDLVEDFPGEIRRLLEFLEVPWDEAVLKHTEHAKRRGLIHTASYHQVAEPIYQRSRFRWQRYTEQLAPVMDTLRPYAERFGY